MMLIQKIEQCRNPRYPQLKTRYKVGVLKTYPENIGELKSIIKKRAGAGEYVVVEKLPDGKWNFKTPVWQGRIWL